MELEFVAHSSVIYRHDGIELLCDPWLLGTAFDDGWALLSEPVHRPEDFTGVTHLWFSHEHPDHFSPRTLSAIPEDIRRRIVVMYHESDDGKIRAFCEKLGFGGFLELAGGAWYELSADFRVRCDRWKGTDDSWLLVKSRDAAILNLNDCQVGTEEELRSLKRDVGPVDTLLTQFSISAWDGNARDLDRRKAGAATMLNRMVLQTDTLGARHVIPFASFIWFCHAENAYMNDALASASEASQAITSRTSAQAVVLYPGDRWIHGRQHDSRAAEEKYERDKMAIGSRPAFAAKRVPLDDLAGIGERFRVSLTAGISPLRRRVQEIRRGLRLLQRRRQAGTAATDSAGLFSLLFAGAIPARIWLTDHAEAVEFDLMQGLRSASVGRASCDVEVSSAALAYALRFLWGGESLQVNGRFDERYADGRIALFEYLWLASAMNHEAGATAAPI
ncbi:MAG: MBL fold metallo-hydrolase [Pseudomonadales bacterium]|nr:MBL fold metallo-hydrolase [Pseudomonadales bacterium]